MALLTPATTGASDIKVTSSFSQMVVDPIKSLFDTIKDNNWNLFLSLLTLNPDSINQVDLCDKST